MIEARRILCFPQRGWRAALVKCALTTASLGLCLASAAAARAEPVPPIRELIVQSETVVLAAPAGPGRFKTARVLLGAALKNGDVLEIDDFAAYDLTAPGADGATERKPVKVTEALLFLGPREEAAPVPRFPLLPSGLRIVAADGGVYRPERQDEPHYNLLPYRSRITWDELVRKAAADAAETAHVQFIRKIEYPIKRNRALLDWVERRRREFGGGLSMDDGDEPAAGWGSLEQDVFQWIFESGIPSDCWAAVKAYAELNGGATPPLRAPAFGTQAGRTLLLTAAQDENALAGDRSRALDLLGAADTLWPRKSNALPAAAALSKEEQTALIDRLTPMLKDSNPTIRGNATAAILEASSPIVRDDLASFHTQRAQAALEIAYNAEPPGWVRNWLARAVGVIGGPKRWEQLTGNAHGVVALLEDPGCRREAEAYCWFWVPQVMEPIGDDPTLVLERLDDKGKPVETKQISLALKYGLTHYDAISDQFTFSMAGFAAGSWRMTVKGVAGKNKAPWSSEPRLLRVAAPPQPGQPNANPSAPRITFDP
jgi:hypothetical protein